MEDRLSFGQIASDLLDLETHGDSLAGVVPPPRTNSPSESAATSLWELSVNDDEVSTHFEPLNLRTLDRSSLLKKLKEERTSLSSVQRELYDAACKSSKDFLDVVGWLEQCEEELSGTCAALKGIRESSDAMYSELLSAQELIP